jgi:hypothetical protein
MHQAVTPLLIDRSKPGWFRRIEKNFTAEGAEILFIRNETINSSGQTFLIRKPILKV